jgi:aspartate/methionine/tyrosine aminotransferase
MKMKNANRLDQIAPSGIRELFARSQGIPGVISLGIGQPDIPTPKELVNNLVNAVKSGDNYYSPTRGTKKYLEAVAEKNKREYGIDYDIRGGILSTASGCEALYSTLMAFVDEGDEVLIPDPSFLTYPRQVTLAGGKAVWLQLNEELRIDPEFMKESISEKTKAIILNFPSNPTGEIMTASELQAIVDIAVDKDLIILSDEVYEKTIFTGESHVAVPSLDNAYENTLLLYSFSKTFCVPGWRIGYVAGPKELVGPVEKIHSFVIANAPSAQQNAIAEFLNTKEADEFTDNAREILKKRRDKLTKGFNTIEGFDCRTPKGSFYAFPNVENHKKYTTSKEFSEMVFEKAKVVLVPGSEFGPSGEGYLRASFGSISLEEIDDVITRLQEM